MNTEKCPPISEFNAVLRYVAKRLYELVTETHGNCIGFRPAWLWCTRIPIHLTVIHYIVKQLAAAGYVELIRRRSTGARFLHIYRLCKSSPLWAAAKAGPDAAYELIVNALDHA